MDKNFVKDLLLTAHDTSNLVQPRSQEKVFLHMRSELGELDEEIKIAMGELYKDAGPDGIIGEAADVLICISDLIWISTTSSDLRTKCVASIADSIPDEHFSKSSEERPTLSDARASYILQTANLFASRQPRALHQPQQPLCSRQIPRHYSCSAERSESIKPRHHRRCLSRCRSSQMRQVA